MPKIQLRNTRISVLLLSILVLFLPLFIGSALSYHLARNSFQDTLITAVSSQLPPASAEKIDRQPLRRLLRTIQVPLLLMMIFLVSGSTLALIFFYRYLLQPMEKMALRAGQIVEGNFDKSMPESSCVEINELCRAFNELSINFQEFILLTWNHLRHSSRRVDHIIENQAPPSQTTLPPEICKDLLAVRKEMHALERVITSFRLYDVQIIDQRAMAGSEFHEYGTESRSAGTAPADGYQRGADND